MFNQMIFAKIVFLLLVATLIPTSNGHQESIPSGFESLKINKDFLGKFDTNGDEKLDKSEIGKGIAELIDNAKREEFPEGGIPVDTLELLTSLGQNFGIDLPEPKDYDQDQNGKLDKNEVKPFWTDAAMKAGDLDKDGLISNRELFVVTSKLRALSRK